MPDLVSCTVDTSNLMRGIEISRAYSHRTPQIAVNTAGYQVAWGWYNRFPVVAQGTIDTQMNAPARMTIRTGKFKGTQTETSHSVGEMIVVSRLHPSSRYSAMTGNYWALRAPEFHGRRDKSSAFWGWVKQKEELMIKARHSSTGFLRSCIIPIIRMLKPFASRSVGGGGGNTLSSLSGEDFDPNSGWAIPAKAGALVATCEIANAAGTSGINSVLYTKHNVALHRVGVMPLNEAIQAEYESTLRYVAKQEMERDRAKYAAVGFTLT